MTKEVKSKQSLNIVFSVWNSLEILSPSWSDLASSNTPFRIREWVPSGCLQTSSLPMPTKRSTQENLPYPRKQSAYNTAQVRRTTFGSRYTKHSQEKYNLHRIFMIGCGVLPLAYAVVHLGPANPDAVSFGAMCAAHEDSRPGLSHWTQDPSQHRATVKQLHSRIQSGAVPRQNAFHFPHLAAGPSSFRGSVNGQSLGPKTTVTVSDFSGHTLLPVGLRQCQRDTL